MIAFVGLGNPGDNYSSTRHNAGFMVLDRVATEEKCSFKPGRGNFFFANAL